MKIRTVQSKLTHEQLQEYLERISWTGDAPQATLSCLRLLMRNHLTSIPFSNHFIAYQESIPDLDLYVARGACHSGAQAYPSGSDKLFDRLVRRRGGFFCFGQNLLFREVLRAIGFRCYSTAARVNSEHATSEEVSLGALNHMCIFVSLEADREEQEENHLYLVDVGFGALNINAPLRLCEGAQALGAVNEQHRIARIQHPTSSLIPGHAESGLTGLPLGLEFALQYRTLKQDGQPAHPWRTCYAFALTEMSSDDYESFHFSTCRRSPLFSSNVVASVLIDTGDEQQPLGKLTIFNDKMQKRLPAAEPEKTTITTEKERLRILREQFGLGDIPDDAQTTIRNKGFALP